MRRGEIWLADFGAPIGTRPALVVSSDRLNRTRIGSIIVVPLTTRFRDLPHHVEIENAALDEVSYAQPENVQVIVRRRLVHRIAIAPAGVVRAVDDELRSVLAL